MALPTYPMVNKPALYVTGLGLAWVSNTTITVAAGQARDSNNINDISLSALVTINAAVNGVNGLDTGSLAATTLYSVYVVGSSTSAHNTNGLPVATCGMLSLSTTTPALPFGYDMYRRIGTVRTDGSSHILLFTQSAGRKMWYDASIPTGITAGAATSYTAVNLESAVPASASVVTIQATLAAGTAFDKVFLQPFGATASYAILTSPVITGAMEGMLDCPVGLNTGAADLKYKVSSGGDSVALNVQAYTDTL